MVAKIVIVVACWALPSKALRLTRQPETLPAFPGESSFDFVEEDDIDFSSEVLQEEWKQASQFAKQHGHIMKSAIVNSPSIPFDVEAAKARVLHRTMSDIDRVEMVKQPLTWMIVDGQLYARKGYEPKHKGKNDMLMKDFIASVLPVMRQAPPDITFTFSFGSLGTNTTNAPRLAIARKLYGRDPWQTTHGGILVPNPYFIGVNYWKTMSNYWRARAKARSWSQRTQRLFWRGKIWNYPKDFGNVTISAQNTDGNRERLQCARLSNEHTNLLDVKLEGGVDRSTYCERAYLLNLPGGRRGGYSQNLNHLWSTGSVVLQWESRPGSGPIFDEWYYPALETNVTHMVVNAENVLQVVKYFQENESLAERLGAMGPVIHDTFLCPCCMVCHFSLVFQALGAKMSVDLRSELQKEPDAWTKMEMENEEETSEESEQSEQCACL